MANLTINLTIIIIGSLYIIGAIIARVFDRLDKKKMGLIFMDKKIEANKYYYKMDVFTGARPNSDTDSKVWP
jgi:hypothetical protein